MTPKEIRENLLRTLDKNDGLCADKTNVESLLRKDCEAYEREMADAETRYKAEKILPYNILLLLIHCLDLIGQLQQNNSVMQPKPLTIP